MARTASYDRDTVLDRARDLFWEKGIEGTSLKDLEAAFKAALREALPAHPDTPGLARWYQAQVFGLRAYAERAPDRAATKDVAARMAATVRALA